MPENGAYVEQRGGVAMLVWPDGGCRPATAEEARWFAEAERLRGHLASIALAVSVRGFSYHEPAEEWATGGYPPPTHPEIPDKATTGIEPVHPGSRSTIEDSEEDTDA